MIEFIAISSAINRQIRLLEKSAKKGNIAIQQYKSILDTLIQGDFTSNTLSVKRTKNGENRIKSCIKYDLGCGYRLVTIKNSNTIYLPFIGTHDEVDYWLCANRDFEKSINSSDYVLRGVLYPSDSYIYDIENDRISEPVDHYEQALQENLSETILRQVFSGLLTPAKG